MNTKITLLAALLFAGASQAALAQDHDHGADHPGDRPQAQDHGGSHGGGGGGGEHRGGGAPSAAPHAAPQAAPQAPQQSPQGGHARFGAPPPPSGPPAAPAVVGQPSRGGRDGPRDGDRRFDGERHFDSRGDRGGDRDRSSFAPGGTAPGDRRWDRHDAPREVIPPVNGEHGWDRDHDGHAGDGRALNHDGRNDGRWDRDHRGPPPNWRHWERGQLPPIYSSPHRYRVGPYQRPYGWYVRSWGFGDFLPRGWYGPSFWVDDFYDYDLPYPPPGMHWVRVGDDVLLVDDYSGRIVQVIRDMFW